MRTGKSTAPLFSLNLDPDMKEKPLVIFGAGKIGEVVLHCWRQQGGREVAAVAVDAAYRKSESWHGLPLLDFEEIERSHPPGDYDLFVAIGYQELNAFRARKMEEARGKGYTLPSFRPDRSEEGGYETGDNCFVMPGAMVHPCAQLRDGVFVWSGAIVGHHSEIGSYAWVTSGANVAGNVKLGAYSFLAINSTVVDGITLGERCFIGANALVAKSADPGSVFIEKGTDRFRLDVDQFLKLTRFQSL